MKKIQHLPSHRWMIITIGLLVKDAHFNSSFLANVFEEIKYEETVFLVALLVNKCKVLVWSGSSIVYFRFS